jgi:hypothetical protein
VNSYQVRQLAKDGKVLSEVQVEAHDYNAALRQLKEVFRESQRIEVYNEYGKKAGEMRVDYWRRMVHSR